MNRTVIFSTIGELLNMPFAVPTGAPKTAPWTEKQKALYAEAIIGGYDMPPIAFADIRGGAKFLLIDGQKRIDAIQAAIAAHPEQAEAINAVPVDLVVYECDSPDEAVSAWMVYHGHETLSPKRDVLSDEKTAAVMGYVEAVESIGQDRYDNYRADTAAAIIATVANVTARNRHIRPQHLRGSGACKYLSHAGEVFPLSDFPAFVDAIKAAKIDHNNGYEVTIYGIIRYALELSGKKHLLEV